ncbi:MAG: SpoIIE family protein phosphatase [Chlamydiales bacterium]
MINRSFTLRVLVISFILLALPLLIYSFIFFQATYNQEIENLKKQMRQDGYLRTFVLSEVEQSKRILLKEFDTLFNISEKLENLDPAVLSQQLAEIALVGGNIQIYIMELSQTDEYKIIASSDSDAVGTFFKNRVKFRQAIEGKDSNFIRYVYSEKEEESLPYIYMVQVIRSKGTNDPIAIFMIVVSMEKEFNSILAETEEADDLDFAILNPDGIVMQSTQSVMRGSYFGNVTEKRKEELIGDGAITFPIASEPLPITKTDDEPFFEFVFQDDTQLAYKLDFPTLGLSVVIYAPKEFFFKKVLDEFLLIYIVYALIFLIGGGVVFWLSYWISRPLKQLSYVMEEVSAGNLNVRFKEQPLGFEINLLGTSFNHTLNTLLKNIEQAEEERVKIETYQKEIAIAREVQTSLLPFETMPIVEGIELKGCYLPAEEVGGDSGSTLARKTEKGESVVFIGIGDPSGLGISSCLYSLSVRNLIQAYSTLYEDVGEILSKANNDFLEDVGETGTFMTFLLSAYYPLTKRLDYYSCGHIPAMVRRSDGELITLASSGIALGLKEAKEPYKADSIQLHTNDIVVFYTDGVFEMMNENNERFSKEQFEECLKQKSIVSAQDMLDALSSTLKTFGGTMPQIEDVVILVLKVTC